MQLGFRVMNDVVVGFSLVTRVQTTLRGSADDIGWLQRIPGALPVEDGTSEFLQALDTIRLVTLVSQNFLYFVSVETLPVESGISGSLQALDMIRLGHLTTSIHFRVFCMSFLFLGSPQKVGSSSCWASH